MYIASANKAGYLHLVLYSIGLFGSSHGIAFDFRGEELGCESREAPVPQNN